MHSKTSYNEAFLPFTNGMHEIIRYLEIHFAFKLFLGMTAFTGYISAVLCGDGKCILVNYLGFTEEDVYMILRGDSHLLIDCPLGSPAT